MNDKVRKDHILVCQTKERYESNATAMVQVSIRMKRDGYFIRTYRCKVCNGWHLTSTLTKKKAQGKKKRKTFRDRHRENVKNWKNGK